MTADTQGGRKPSRALAALGVRGDEARLVGWVAALFFVIQANHGVGLNAADALFFLRFGVEHLPVMILSAGFVVMLGVLGYAAGLSWKGPRAWLWPFPLGCAGWVVVERVGIAADLSGIYPVVWLSAQLVMMATFTLMWNVAGEVCTTRQAKRLFPLFASAGIAGGIFGNALTGPTAALLGTENLLLVQAGLLVTGGLLALGTSRRFLDEEDAGAASSPAADLRAGLIATWRTPLLRLVALVTLALSVLFYLVVFPFSQIVAASFDTEAGVAGYLGLFSSIATAATFLVSLLVARALFTRLGVVVTLLIVPIAYAAGFLLWLAAFTLVTASLVRGAQWIAINALGGTATSSLFNVLRGRRRAQVMAFVTAVPAQVGTVLSGALLLVAGGLSMRSRFALSFALAVAAGLLVLRMRSAYRKALVDAVRGGLLDIFTAPTTGLNKPDLEADALHAIETGLAHEDPGRRRVATVIVGRLGGDRSAQALRDRLADPDAGVRLAALEALRSGDAIELLLGDPDPAVRLRAVTVAVETGHLPDPDTTSRLLDDPDPALRGAAAALLGGDDGKAVVAELIAAGDLESVAAGLEAVAADASLCDPAALARLADHESRRVRRTLATALSPGGSDSTLRRLLDDVSPRVRAAAGRALAGRSEGRSLLRETLARGSVRASEAALGALVDADAHPQLSSWIESEMDRATTLRRWQSSLEGDGASEARRYLARVLRSRRERLERWAIKALEANDASLAAVCRGAWSDDVETRSQALEALESIADRPVARRLIDLIEAGADARMDPAAAHREMAADFDPWIRALAVRAFSVETPAGADQGGDGMPVDDRILDRMLTLQRVPILSALDPEELHLVAQAAAKCSHRAGEFVFRMGSTGDEMLVITEGSVEVRVGDVLIATRGAEDVVGELSILRGRARMADVVAGPSGVAGMTVAADALHDLLEERPEAAMAMLATLAERIAELLPDGPGDSGAG